MNKKRDKHVREPIVEGIFYPSAPDDLKNLIENYIKNGKKGTAPLIISPHAGYDTAGQQMADAVMSAADSDIEEVVIIAPLHREEEEKIILPVSSLFRTPAGDLEVNMKSLYMFKGEETSIVRDEIPHIEEHAIEDQLPMISHILGEVKILPVLLGKTTITMVKKLTKALKRAYGESPEKVLFIISSNLSSYGQSESAGVSGENALNLFKEGNWRDICEQKRTGRIEACGAGPLASVMALYNRKMTMKILSRSESAGKESEKGKVVLYGAVSFTPEEEK